MARFNQAAVRSQQLGIRSRRQNDAQRVAQPQGAVAQQQQAKFVYNAELARKSYDVLDRQARALKEKYGSIRNKDTPRAREILDAYQRVSAQRDAFVQEYRAQGYDPIAEKNISRTEKRVNASVRTTQTASVSVPLGATGAAQSAGFTSTTQSQPFQRPASLTDRNINYVVSGRANYSTPIERKIAAQQVREQKQGAFVERQKDRLRSIPGLRGDNFAQRTAREALALPVTIPVMYLQTGQRAVLATQSYVAQPQKTRSELKQAAKETPRAAVQSFDPRQPSGLVNLGLLGVGGFGAIRGARIAPARPAQTLGVTRVSSSPVRTLVTERVAIGGTFNRIVGRQGTRTTRITPDGKVRVSFVADSFLGSKGARVTDTFSLGSKTFSRRVNTGGKIRTYENVRTRTIAPAELSLEGINTRVLRQNTAENLQKNIIKQESVRRESGSFFATLGRKSTVGTGTLQGRNRAISELGPTTLVSRTKFGDLTTQKTGIAATREFFQRSLRLGRRTSPEQRARLNQRPTINLDIATIEQTSIVARTPAPRTTYAESLLVEFRGVRPARGRSLGRKGSTTLSRLDPLSKFKETITQPREIAPINARATGRFTTSVPRVAARSGGRSALAFGSFQVVRPSSIQQTRSSLAASRSAYSFDVDVRPASSLTTQQTQEFTPSSGSRSSSRTSQSPLITTPFFSSAALSQAPTRTAGVPALFRPYGGASDTKSSGRGTRRSYRPSRSLFEVTFNRGSLGRLAKKTPGGFTGLELTRSFNPKKKSKRKKR